MTTQPEAARVERGPITEVKRFALGMADLLERQGFTVAAAELRRLHAELERCKQVCAATSEAWREEAALAEPVQEPVAWIHTDPDMPRVKFLEWRENEPGYRGDWIKTPLFTSLPQRKPLTEWQINDLMADIDPEDRDSWSFRQGVYAAEKHHGVRK